MKRKNYTNEELKPLLEYLKKYPTIHKGAALCSFFRIRKIDLRLMVHQLRVNEEPIVSSNGGYKFSNDRDEIRKCLFSLRKRGESIIRASNGLEGSIKTI